MALVAKTLTAASKGLEMALPVSNSVYMLYAVAMNEGERILFRGPKGPVLVARVGGKLNAIDAMHPFSNSFMGDGDIIISKSGPGLQCPTHGSIFNMKTGKCESWVTGYMGLESDGLGRMMCSYEKTDISTYDIVDKLDGTFALQTKSE
eukprot:gnl/TRDRNA2_/TRDRNA2_45249_c0_seq1.p1 gnl/TRDRNA2_/TRDRNA2_45249_c0~~gnl/TRDRNA2_/TRDRNA2_45249_c0_seq1.p1  ORF type:complete len:149 (+),score=19.98 gnl/TRDRNA2_/TRDRNA2_45249_c0_seq1:64-510(+)